MVEEQKAPRSRWLPVHPWVWWATLPMLVMLLAVVWGALQRPEISLFIVGRFVLAMGVPLLILPQVVYFFSGRSVLAASIAFCLVCAGWYGIALYAFLSTDFEARLSALRPGTAEVLQGSLQRELDPASMRSVALHERSTELSRILESFGERLEGDAGRAATALAPVARELAEVGGAHSKATAALAALSPHDHRLLRTRADFEVRVRAVDRTIAACRDVSLCLQEVGDRVRTKLRDARVPVEEIDGLVEMFVHAGALTGEVHLCWLDLKLLDPTRRMLLLLYENRDLWTLSPETGEVETDSAVLFSELEELREEIRVATNERKSVLRQFTIRLQKRPEAAER